MDYEEIIEKAKKYSELVVEALNPQMIILYGSYAKGTAGENSDIDIAVICDYLGEDFLEKSFQLFKLRRKVDIRIEPIIIETCNDRSGFYQDILDTGKIIYAA